MQTTNFIIDQKDLFKTASETVEISELTAGEVLFKIDKYAFTSNNVTYAVMGHRLKYWAFFPTAAPNGIVPVWGFADVVASKNEQVKVGERVYGYFPMSDYLKIQAGKVNPYGFSDVAEHRKKLSPIYNYYSRTAADPTYKVELEDYIPIIKPLFATSFLNYHFLKDENFMEGENVILTSASSKTALGLAFVLKQHQATDNKKIIGFTSTRNVDFVKKTGFYDEVFAYDQVADNLPDTASILVDFAGNASLLHQVYDGMGDNIKYMSLIGLTDWSSDKKFNNIPIAHFFFAPTHIQTRYATWGAEKTNLMLSKGLFGFIQTAKDWIEVEYIDKNEGLENLYTQMLKGEIDPSKGYMVR